MQTLDELRALSLYNDWANDRLIAMLYAAFGEETDLRQAADKRIIALQETVTHLIAAAAVWRSRWEGVSPKGFLDPAEYPTPLTLRMALGAERARFWGFFETLTADADLHQPLSYATTTGETFTEPLLEMLQHVLLHSMYHRGQVTACLIDLGHENVLVSTDLIVFYREAKK